MTSPGRLEVIRRSPTIVLDAAHNPHGAEAPAAALEDSFSFSPLIGVMGVMDDKDHEGLLEAFEPHLAHVVCTQNSTPRSLSAAALGRAAAEIFGEDRVSVVPDLADAIDRAATLAEAGEAIDVSIGAGAVLVTGSVVTVGEARAMLKGRRRARTSDAAGRPPTPSARRAAACAPPCSRLEAIALGLTTPVMITIADVDDRHRAGGRARPRRGVPAARRDAPRRVGLPRRAARAGRGDRPRVRGAR